jgi:hypothetical protein
MLVQYLKNPTKIILQKKYYTPAEINHMQLIADRLERNNILLTQQIEAIQKTNRILDGCLNDLTKLNNNHKSIPSYNGFQSDKHHMAYSENK